MAPSSTPRDSARHRRISLFGLTTINTSAGASPVRRSSADVSAKDPPSTTKTLKKRNTTSAVSDLDHTGQNAGAGLSKSPPSSHQTPTSKPPRSSLSLMRPSVHLPRSNMFGSVRSLRSGPEDDTTASETSSKPPSVNWTADDNSMIAEPISSSASASTSGATPSKLVLMHGEVQTSSTLFRKKKEYLVLTETHLVRFKTTAKAVDAFPAISPKTNRTSYSRHSSAQSLGDLRSVASDTSTGGGERDGRTPLRHIVAVHRPGEGKLNFTMEICFLDEDTNHPSAVALQFSHAEERDAWLVAIRSAAATLAVQEESTTASEFNTAHAARIVERESDYDPDRFAIFKVVQRQTRASNRSSTDDLSKIASTVCLLIVGIHKVHLIPLPRSPSRTSSSSPSLSQTDHGSYGVLTMTALKVNPMDDSLQITFRMPYKRPKVLYLASAMSHQIALRLLQVDNALRPECPYRLFRFQAPRELEEAIIPRADPNAEEHSGLVTTLTAYCMAYDVNPSMVRYTIDYECEDAPRFVLLAAAESRRRNYQPMELLAVMRALRYNETFGSISFANVRLDGLNTMHDPYGAEYLCTRSKRGVLIEAGESDLQGSSLLVQEIRAIAATSARLRRLDFTNCINISVPVQFGGIGDDNEISMVDTGCGIVEALFPLCKYQNTNVDWIVLDGIALSDADLDYLVGAAVDRSCHFRALEVGRCGLHDRTLGLVMDTLRAQDNTLEALNLSGNLARISPGSFDSQISVFVFIRRLDLSNLARTSGEESLLAADTLLTWRLEVLRLSGTDINKATIDALATYLRDAQSDSLHELCLDNTNLIGSDIYVLMDAMTRPGRPRGLHLDISGNKVVSEHSKFVDAFIENKSPTHVTLRSIQYRDTSTWRHLFNALRKNTSTVVLDVSRTSLPGDASDETAQALEHMFVENNTLEELDISGHDSRLETSKFGQGLLTAMSALKANKKMHTLRMEYQKLGLQGANVLADVLKVNQVLREVHCEHNGFPLSGFTDLVNALHKNTALVFLPMMDESRLLALKQTERQVKQIRDDRPLSPHKVSSATPAKSSFGVRKGLANVRQTVTRGASNYTPSFPSFPYLSSPHLNGTRSDDVLSGPTSPRPLRDPNSGPMLELSEQDIQAALRLVAESWDRQQYRLQKYLERNWCLLHKIPTRMEIDEEDFERPYSGPRTGEGEAHRDSMTSFREVLDQVRIDSTPRLEKEFSFQVGAGSLDLQSMSDTSSVSVDGSDAHALSPQATKLASEYLSPMLDSGILDRALEHSPLSFESTNTDASGSVTPHGVDGAAEKGLGIHDDHDDEGDEVLTPRP